ncbi:LysM peptidoglycan-binding domain-containing protein [Mesorhizobium atlanticum]
MAAHYHVPADAIAKVNGIDPKKGIRSGQKIVIPAYAYSSKSEPKVAQGKPANAPKQPAGAPEKVAVLPQQPKVKDGKSAAQVDTSAAAAGSKNPKPATQLAEAKPAGAGGHLYCPAGRLAVVNRQEDRRRRHGAEAGQRHAGRLAQDRTDAQGPGRWHRRGCPLPSRRPPPPSRRSIR